MIAVGTIILDDAHSAELEELPHWSIDRDFSRFPGLRVENPIG